MAANLVICSIPDNVKDEFKAVRFSKETTMTALFLKISRETHELEVAEKLTDSSIEEIQDELPSQQPRFVLMSWMKKHEDGRCSYPMTLVYYCPSGCSPELQMLYAGSRNFIANECQLTKNLEIRDIEELTMELLDSKF